MIRLLLSTIACSCILLSCGPLEGGDPLDGPPTTEGPSLKLRDSPQSAGTTGAIGVSGNYDRY